MITGSGFFKKYLLPGFVFQSVVIAGGYGTGREIVEYFLSYGPLGGLLGMLLISTVMWSVTLAITFEFSRVFNAYDYRTFFRNLLGKYWITFELLYMFGMLLILAVIGSAAGELLKDTLPIPYIARVAVMFLVIGFLTFKGSSIIAQFLAYWSILLYIVYGIILIVALQKFGPDIWGNFSEAEAQSGWLTGGFKYALYNFAVIPAVMFCLSHQETRREAITAGLLGGVIGIFPGLLFFIAIVSQYPAVIPETLPMIFMLNEINLQPLLIIFYIVLFGTLIETGTGFIHAYNERLHTAFQAKGREFPRHYRPVVAAVLLLIGLGISKFGLITLIAKGYGTLSWLVFIIFVIPLFTVGIIKIKRGN
ncbi:hypothetical protein ACFL6L_02795 [candidate division KSB1 bacterium]